jgi:hypothetical protein
MTQAQTSRKRHHKSIPWLLSHLHTLCRVSPMPHDTEPMSSVVNGCNADAAILPPA